MSSILLLQPINEYSDVIDKYIRADVLDNIYLNMKSTQKYEWSSYKIN